MKKKSKVIDPVERLARVHRQVTKICFAGGYALVVLKDATFLNGEIVAADESRRGVFVVGDFAQVRVFYCDVAIVSRGRKPPKRVMAAAAAMRAGR